MKNIFINNYQDKIKLDKNKLKNFALFCINKFINTRDFEISITFLSKVDITNYNKQYLNHNYPTDVISFPLQKIINNHLILGDILICPEYIKEYCEIENLNFDKELLFVLAHGILHIFNYKDKTDKQRKEMFNIQENLIQEYKNNAKSEV